MRSFLLALLFSALGLAQGQPSLSLDTHHHDFGKLAANAIVTHRFIATNTGGARLTIARLTPGCGCTSTVVGKDTLAPGEHTELEVTFHASGNQGHVEKNVVVASDDPVNPTQVLTFEADVQAEVVTADPDIWFRNLEPSSRSTASVKVASGTGQPIVLSDVKLSKAPWLGVATREEGQELWLDLQLVARRLPPGRRSGTDTITLRLANPRPQSVTFNVHWERRALVTAEPGRVAWAEPAGRELQAFVQLNHGERKPFRILSARTSSPLLTVAGLSPQAAATQAVTLHLSAAAPAGTYQEKAFLTLDTPGHPELEIPVAVSLR